MSTEVVVIVKLLFVTNLFVTLTSSSRLKRGTTSSVCPRGCRSCSPLNGCVTCESNFYLLLQRAGIRQTGECVASCPAGYYGVRRGNFNKCNKCRLSHCTSCFGATYCTRCATPFIAFEGQCVESCPTGLFYATYTKQCLPQVNCEVSPWSPWQPCSRDGRNCGYKYGVQSRTRMVLQNAAGGGSDCPTGSKETRTCRLAARRCKDFLLDSEETSDSTSGEADQARIRKHKRRKSEHRRNENQQQKRTRRLGRNRKWLYKRLAKRSLGN